MRCLSDVDLQAVADGEASDDAAAHVAGCGRCRERVERVRQDLRDVAALVNTAGDLPSRVEARVRNAIVSHEPVRGSTRLRGGAPGQARAWRRPRIVLPLATAAVIALMVFGILPRLGAPTTLSASQVLGRSLETLSNRTGVEVMDYEFVVSGLHHGTYYLQIAIDHEQPARFRAKTFLPDGTLVGAISQDPIRQRRSQLVRVDDRNYIVNVASLPSPVASLPQMAQALVETAITMMQAGADQKLSVVETSEGRQYVVEMPAVTPTTTATTLDLYRARVAVDADDFRIREFEAAGALLKQPFSISFKLVRSSTVFTNQEVFTLEPAPGDVVLEGIAADHPADELLTTIVRELARSRVF